MSPISLYTHHPYACLSLLLQLFIVTSAISIFIVGIILSLRLIFVPVPDDNTL